MPLEILPLAPINVIIFNIFHFKNTPINEWLRSDYPTFYLKQYKAW
jgi:hypothetical protein